MGLLMMSATPKFYEQGLRFLERSRDTNATVRKYFFAMRFAKENCYAEGSRYAQRSMAIEQQVDFSADWMS